MTFDHRGGSKESATRSESRAAATPGKRTLSEQVSVQLKAGAPAASDPAAVQEAAAAGVSGAGGSLPFLDRIQSSFGRHDVSGVKAHVGGEATAAAHSMGAQAYATGNQVAFGDTPSLHLAAHEAAHVVQQRAGVHLKGGVGEAGDAYERNADEVADRVVQGRSAEDLLPATGGGGAAVQHQVQHQGGKETPKEMTEKQVTAALAWVTKSKIGAEAVKEIQGVCGIDKTGTYDEATAKAVFAKQQELHIGADGMAGATFCQRTGIIFTHEITAATVTDADLETVKTKFPNGVTVAIYPNYDSGVSGRSEFKLQADTFATNQQSVGLSGGAIALGKAIQIVEVGDVIEVVQSIHRGLLKKWTDAQPAGATGTDAKAAEPPAYTKVLNLALFSHGESWGMGMNSKNDFSGGGLHNNTTRSGLNPPNIEAFVRGLSDAVVKGIRVELFACSTGHDESRSEYDEWTNHKQGDKAGGDSFGSSLAQGFGKDATVSAHTTVGHTTENYAARVFGAEAGADAGGQGITLFDAMYPETYVQSELTRLFPDLGSDDRGARHDSLREQMWAHFKDAILGDHKRAQKDKRYPVPMGQECFTNPSNARSLLDTDWKTNWIPKHLTEVKPAPAKKEKK